MKIDKTSDIWRTAPWHVRFSAAGLKTDKSIRTYRDFSFWSALIGVTVAFFSLITGLLPVLTFGFHASGLWFSACMYWFALDWLRNNPKVMTSA